MSDYTPDKWEIIAQVDPEATEVWHRILSSWYGGFAGADSWKMSSQIERIEETDRYYNVHCNSGSCYKLYKGIQGVSSYTSSVFTRMKKRLDTAGGSLDIIKSIQASSIPITRIPEPEPFVPPVYETPDDLDQ